MSNKEQMQVRVLGGLVVAAAGYFGIHMFAPSSAPAPRPAATASERVKLAALVVPDGPQDAPAPFPGMKNPFVPAIADLPSTAAPPAAPPAPHPDPAKKNLVPAASALPATTPPSKASSFSVPPLPAAVETVQPLPQSAPAAGLVPAARSAKPVMHWIVSGVLNGGGSAVAILRDGDARRFVRQGDLVDSTFRVTQITQTGIVLKGGGTVAHLQLASPGASQARGTASKPSPAPPTAPPVLPVAPNTPTANAPVNAIPVQQ